MCVWRTPCLRQTVCTICSWSESFVKVTWRSAAPYSWRIYCMPRPFYRWEMPHPLYRWDMPHLLCRCMPHPLYRWDLPHLLCRCSFSTQFTSKIDIQQTYVHLVHWELKNVLCNYDKKKTIYKSFVFWPQRWTLCASFRSCLPPSKCRNQISSNPRTHWT